MSLFRPSRERSGPDPYYHWKAVLFSIGGGAGLAAIATGRDWLILVAVPILAVGVALRWVPRRGGDRDEEPQEPDDGSTPENERERR